jgi:hypothetical protein
MLTAIIVVLLILWLLGYLGPAPFRRGGNTIHILLVIVVILIVLSLLRII